MTVLPISLELEKQKCISSNIRIHDHLLTFSFPQEYGVIYFKIQNFLRLTNTLLTYEDFLK